MVLMRVCSFDPFYVGPCPPGCLAPLTGGPSYCNNFCGCGPCCGSCCSSSCCGW